MGLFGQSSPFDVDVEKATSEKNTSEPWGVIIDICDKVGSNPRNAKDCLKSIMRRMGHNDPHVVIQAITLLDACVNNCGKNFHLEVASRDFENEFIRLLSKSQPQVATKMRLLLKKWAENDFKTDPQLNLIPSLYQKLKSEGHDFSENQKAPKASIPASVIKDPNVVTSQQEEDDIAKAIELSLKGVKDSPKKQQTSSNSSPYASLYPWLSGGSGGSTSGTSTTSSNQPEPRKVRALYDFEAAEDNELTFVAGDIIHVIDDSDPNWWKGYNSRGEGLFPSNFVTADLSVEPERLDVNSKSKKSDDEAKQGEKTESKFEEDKDYVPEINEEKIDRLLHLLHEANPEDSSQDSEEMLRLETEVNKMGPLIDAELERVDRKHAQLTQLSSDLVDAINLYHTLMREPDRTAMPPVTSLPGSMGYMPGNFNPQHNMYGHNAMYGIPPNIYHPGPIATTSVPNSMPSMAMMHMMPGSTQQQQSQSQQPTMSQQLPQMPMMGNTANPGGYPPQQMIPVQYQNGHQPQQQQQQQSQSQAQHPMSPPPQQQSLHNSIAQPNIQSTTSPSSTGQQLMQQAQQQPPNSMNQQQTTAGFHPVQPPTSMGGIYSSQQNSFVPIPNTGNFALPHPSMLPSNSIMGGGMMLPPQQHPPQSMPSMSHNPQLQMAHQMSAINQPITHSLLGQNDSKTNIPIYQQQR